MTHPHQEFPGVIPRDVYRGVGGGGGGSHGDDRCNFLGLKFSIPGFFGSENVASTFLCICGNFLGI